MLDRAELLQVTTELVSMLMAAKSSAAMKNPMSLYGLSDDPRIAASERNRAEVVELALAMAVEIIEAVDQRISLKTDVGA